MLGNCMESLMLKQKPDVVLISALLFFAVCEDERWVYHWQIVQEGNEHGEKGA